MDEKETMKEAVGEKERKVEEEKGRKKRRSEKWNERK